MNEVEDLIPVINKYTIAVVDDDEAVRDSLCVLLSLAGFDVRSYRSASDMLATIEDQAADCLIIDVHMPGMNGLELIESLKAVELKIPVILVSGNFDIATIARARTADVGQLLEKPFSDEHLIGTIRLLLD